MLFQSRLKKRVTMRNLIVLNRGEISTESLTYPDLGLIDAVFETVSNSITIALSSDDSGILEIQHFSRRGSTEILASFPKPEGKILSFTHFIDLCQLVLVFGNGDIITCNYDPETNDPDLTTIEIVGSIDVGIKAASWSLDEETLVILTAENNLLLLSRMFEPINEKQLNPDDIKITDSKHVSVGWGKKETQFKGKGARAVEREKVALKHAGLDVKQGAVLRDPTVAEVERGTLSKFDDHSVKISWRGDSEYFCVSTVEEVIVEDTAEMFDRRVIRVFNRQGVLDSVNEAVDGLEHNVSWKPQGALIASTQRHTDDDGDECLDVVFYERNGLRHGQYNTRLNPFIESVENLEWSSNSEILALQLEDRVQLWSTNNYHWYLKQEIYISKEDTSNKIVFMKFHPDKALHLMIGTSKSGIIVIDLSYKVVTGCTVTGHDAGMTLVTDGSIAKITPLAIANVPPPISLREIELPGNINDLAVSKSNEKYAFITSDNMLHLGFLELECLKKGKNISLFSHLASSEIVNGSAEYVKQVAFINDVIVVIIVDTVSGSRIICIETSDIEKPSIINSYELQYKIVVLKSQSDFCGVVLESIDGTVYQMGEEQSLVEVSKFPLLCREIELHKEKGNTEDNVPRYKAFGISMSGKLFANEIQLATGVTSIKITESHLLFTNVSSKLCFIHLKSTNESYDDMKFDKLNDLGDGALDERFRQIERGSYLVNAIPSKYSVILEAPRGNLETICPRIMVLSGVRRYIGQKCYREAFLACRTHRVDLDLLYDYDPEMFKDNVELVVNQIKEVDHLDLFVSCLHNENVAVTKYKDTRAESHIANNLSNAHISEPEVAVDQNSNSKKRIISHKEKFKFNGDNKVNRVCNLILSVILKPEYFEHYLQTIVTAYACQQPPNLEEALKLVGSIKKGDQYDQAVTRLCFLQDVNLLFDTALGLYDVKLSLAIAQKSQKDPKEYLPFLQNLHIQSLSRKKFLIDDYLKKHEKALQSLFEMQEGVEEEFDEYVCSHGLYKSALHIYKYNDVRSRDILNLYANYLFEQKDHFEAGLTYELLKNFDKAIESYILGKRWREALSLFSKADQKQSISEAAENLVSSLIDDHKYGDAAEIEHNFLNNTLEAVRLYCKNYSFDNAILLCYKEKKEEFLDTIVDEQLGEGFGTVAELLADCKGQMTSQLRRLRELREKKKEDPYSFYGTPNDDVDTPDNVSIAASETSTTPSFFTRYTGKTSGTAKTGASRRTAKNRKREERKKAKGRKGTIYEEEYLIKSVGRLLERLDQTQSDATRLIEGLIRRNKKEQAYQIQNNWVELIIFIKENIVEVHSMSEKDREREDDNGEIYLIPEIPVPEIHDFPKFNILDF